MHDLWLLRAWRLGLSVAIFSSVQWAAALSHSATTTMCVHLSLGVLLLPTQQSVEKEVNRQIYNYMFQIVHHGTLEVKTCACQSRDATIPGKVPRTMAL